MTTSLGLAAALLLLAPAGAAFARSATGEPPNAQERLDRDHEQFKEGAADAAGDARRKADRAADSLQRRLGTGPYGADPATPAPSPGASGAAPEKKKQDEGAKARVDEAHEDFKAGAREAGRGALDAAEKARSRLQETLGTKPEKND